MTVSKSRNSNQVLRGSRGTSRGLVDTSFAFVTDTYIHTYIHTYIYIYMTPVFHFVRDSCSTSFKIEFQDFAW